MSKQTAVDFIISKLSITFQTMYSEEIKQAKEMEKEQIIDACNYGIKLYINDPITSEDYYNETFKNK